MAKDNRIRADLDPVVSNLLLESLNDLRREGSFIKVTIKDFINWIIKHFCNTSYSKNRPLLVSEFTDKKAYLKNALSSVTSDSDVTEVLNQALKDLTSKTKKSRQSRQVSKKKDFNLLENLDEK